MLNTPMEQAMAAPNLTIIREPSGPVVPGTQITWSVTAVDADARTIAYQFRAMDSTGAEVSVVKNVTVSDPVTVTPSVSDPAGTASTPVQDPTNPLLWRSTV